MSERCPNCDLGVVVDGGSRCDAGCDLRPAETMEAVVAERDRYKAALEDIAGLARCECGLPDDAREALR